MQSFCVSQKDIKEALERVTGEKWRVKKYESAKYTKEQKALSDKGDKDATEHVVWILGALDANWEKNDGYAMDLLGLEGENLDAVLKKVV